MSQRPAFKRILAGLPYLDPEEMRHEYDDLRELRLMLEDARNAGLLNGVRTSSTYVSTDVVREPAQPEISRECGVPEDYLNEGSKSSVPLGIARGRPIEPSGGSRLRSRVSMERDSEIESVLLYRWKT